MVIFHTIFDGWNPTSSRAVYWSLLDSRCLVFALSDDETCMKWHRRLDHTRVCATTLKYYPKHQMSIKTEQTKDRPSTHQTYGRAYATSLATRGTIHHKGLGTRNFPLPGSMEVQRARLCGTSAWDMCTFIHPTWKILRILEVQKGTRCRTMNWYRNIRFDPSSMWGRITSVIFYR